MENEMLMDEMIKHELERIKDLNPGTDEYKAAYQCAAMLYEIRVKEKTSTAEKNAKEDELQMKNQELKLEAEKAEKAWKSELMKAVVTVATTLLGVGLTIGHDRFWSICSAGGVQVFDDRYRDGKMICKDYFKKQV